MVRRILYAIKNKLTIASAKYVRRLKSPQKYKTIEYFFNYLKKDEDILLNKPAYSVKDKVITEVCTYDSNAGYYSTYFQKDCACLISTKEDGMSAIEKGACLLITKNDIENLPCLVAKNPLSVYAKWCKYYRDLHKTVSVIAVSGSIGKTTIKNMIGEVIKMQYNTTYTRKNYNTRMTVGFAVQHIPNGAEKMIQEIHEGNPNETQYISEMLHPDIFVLTPIDRSHISRFGSQEKIIEEIYSISNFMTESGIIIVNTDDKYEDLMNGKKYVTVSTKDNSADFYANNINITAEGITFTVNVKQEKTNYNIKLNNIIALHNVECALYAFATGYIVGVPVSVIIKGLANYHTEGVRQNIIRTQDDVLIYADCFNAVGKSMKAAIDACGNMRINGKRIAVLGNIEEAGALSELVHKDIIEYVDKSSFDVLLTFGTKMNEASKIVKTRPSLQRNGYDNLDELANALKALVQKGDLVLFKGSHSCHLDNCILLCWPNLTKVVRNYDNWELTSLFY